MRSVQLAAPAWALETCYSVARELLGCLSHCPLNFPQQYVQPTRLVQMHALSAGHDCRSWLGQLRSNDWSAVAPTVAYRMFVCFLFCSQLWWKRARSRPPASCSRELINHLPVPYRPVPYLNQCLASRTILALSGAQSMPCLSVYFSKPSLAGISLHRLLARLFSPIRCSSLYACDFNNDSSPESLIYSLCLRSAMLLIYIQHRFTRRLQCQWNDASVQRNRTESSPVIALT